VRTGVYNQQNLNIYQINEYRGVAESALPSAVTIMSGDFNMRPGTPGTSNSTVVPQWWWDTLRDSDSECRATSCEQTLVDDNTKFDYQFRGNPRSWSVDSYLETTYDVVAPYSRASDHNLVMGYP